MAEATYAIREYPLEVERTTDGWYWTKGWHDRAEFLAAANYEAELDDDEGAFQEHHVRYTVFRCLPAHEDAGCAHFLIEGRLGVPGAFPVTVVW